MALTTLNTDAISFKKLSGKVHTQQNFAVTEEGISTNVQMSYSTIFANPIVPLPVTSSGLTSLYATNGIVERVKFELDIIPDTQIFDGRSQGYRIKLPADYNTFGYLYPEFSAGTYLHNALGKLQIVPAIYGELKLDGTTEYDPILYQTNGINVINKFSSINWYFDSYSGILFVQDPPVGFDVSASRPGYLEAFLYVGDYLDKLVSNNSGYTASNGISLLGNEFKLGGSLTANTLIQCSIPSINYQVFMTDASGSSTSQTVDSYELSLDASDSVELTSATFTMSKIGTIGLQQITPIGTSTIFLADDGAISLQASKGMLLNVTDQDAELALNAADAGILISTSASSNDNGIRFQSQISGFSTTLRVQNPQISVNSNNSTFKGIVYENDYSSNYTIRSLVDAGFVTGITSEIIINSTGLTLANNGLTKTGNYVRLGGVLTGNTVVDTNTHNITFDIQTIGDIPIFRGSIGSDDDIPLFKIKNDNINDLLDGLVDILLGPSNGNSSAPSGGNIAIGQNNLTAITGSTNNVSIGFGNATASTRTLMHNNISIGNNSGNAEFEYSNSIDIGYEVNLNSKPLDGAVFATATHVAIGHRAMSNLTGTTNSSGMVAIGSSAMANAISRDGGSSIAIGSALQGADFEMYTIALGNAAGSDAVIGRGNILIGVLAGASMTGGTPGAIGIGSTQFNVAIGTHTLENGSGEKGTFVGCEAGSVLVRGQANSGFGNWALNRTTGNYNSGLGSFAGYNVSLTLTGSTNTFIGWKAGYANPSLSNTIVLAHDFNASISNRVYIGSEDQRVIISSANTNTTGSTIVTRDATTGELGVRSIASMVNEVELVIVTGTTYTATTLTHFIHYSGTTSAIIYLPNTPKLRQQIIISDAKGNALSNNITISGNGKLINGVSSALVDSDYGTLMFIYNGVNWIGSGFVS